MSPSATSTSFGLKPRIEDVFHGVEHDGGGAGLLGETQRAQSLRLGAGGITTVTSWTDRQIIRTVS